jgi:hypothetical protein
MREHEYEPVEGLPEDLPEGESLLWQGKPTLSALATRVFHVWSVAIYFVALISAHAIYRIMQGVPWSELSGTLAWQSALGCSVVGVLYFLARAYSRSTLYTVTDRRVVIRSGVALSLIVNVPLTKVRSAGLKRWRDGTGDILLTPSEGVTFSWILLWPNVRPWHYRTVQPLLRGIEAPEHLAEVLRQAARPTHVVADESESRSAVGGTLVGNV